MKIVDIDAFQIFDSRGMPTLEVEVQLDSGTTGSASVPSGASTGQFEALELRDGDPNRFMGKSVFKAIANIKNVIGPALTGKTVESQEILDQFLIDLDGTPNKSRLGANAILGVSMALARAVASEQQLPLFKYLGSGNLLPIPEIQIIGGGAHTGGRIDVQDFMIICNGAETYSECLEMTFNVYHQCGRLLKDTGRLSGLADEGGFWPEFETNDQAFDVILEAIQKAGYDPGAQVSFSLDIAAAELFSNGRYLLGLEDRTLDPDGFYDLLASWCNKYPIISIEDPFAETDLENWTKFTHEFGSRIKIIGDDLFTTDVKRVREGIKGRVANSVLIKLNQIGTVSETLGCIRETQHAGWLPVVSGRSGETEDPFISHLTVASNAGQLKLGSLARSERNVKWNEVLRIERQLGDKARFLGGKIFQNIE